MISSTTSGMISPSCNSLPESTNNVSFAGIDSARQETSIVYAFYVTCVRHNGEYVNFCSLTGGIFRSTKKYINISEGLWRNYMLLFLVILFFLCMRKKYEDLMELISDKKNVIHQCLKAPKWYLNKSRILSSYNKNKNLINIARQKNPNF